MDLYFVFSSLDAILSHKELKHQLIQYLWGLFDYKMIPIDDSDNNDFIIGKITSMLKSELYDFICYLMIIINNTLDTICNQNSEIICIHNLYIILNSHYKNNFISFLKSYLHDKIDNWGEFEKNENCYIIGRLIDMKYEPVFRRASYMLIGINGSNMQTEFAER